MKISLWLDDVRNPVHFGYEDWHWVRTAEEAIAWLAAEDVIIDEASLDHDLGGELPPSDGFKHYITGTTVELLMGKSGYDVVLWLEQHPDRWPAKVMVHSQNPAGRARMQQIIDQHYNSQ